MPVDIASGIVRLEYEDITIPGKVNLVWERRYSTAFLDSLPTALGIGWTSRYFTTLTKRSDIYEFRTPNGAIETFPDHDGAVERGEVIRLFGAFLELFKTNQYYIVQSWDVETGEIIRYCFTPGQSDLPWLLASIENAAGQGLDLKWNQQGKLLSIQQRLERRALIPHYNPSNLIDSISLRSPNGNQHLLARYDYDTADRQIAVYDAAGSTDYYEYDSQNLLTREIIKDGGIFTYRYDVKNRCIRTTGLDRYQEKRLRFFDATNFTEVTDSYEHTSRYQYLPSGQMVREIDPLGNEKSMEYDEHERIIARTDATGATKRYTFNEFGNRNSVTDALGNTYTFTYSDHHQPLSMTDPLGQTWRRFYDSANQLIGATDPLGNRWQIRYDTEGNVAEIVNPLGARKRQKHTQGILDAATDWLGNITRFRLDDFGRVIERQGPEGEITRFNHDVLGNPIEVILPDGATLRATYDNVGNLTSFTNANGHIRRFRYGPCQRLLERTDSVGGVVRYVWGSEPGWLEQVINEKGETYSFFRDEAGRIIREQSFDDAERLFQYNPEGFAIAYTNANGERINIQRDALHRVIGQTLPDGEQVRFSFDATGNLIGAVNADIVVSFERDPLGRIVREVQGEQWVESRYDAVGNLIHTATSLGHTVDYEIDANGFVSKLTTLDNQSIQFKRNAYGRETARQMLGGLIMEQHYDQLGRLIEQRIGPGRIGSSHSDDTVIPPQREIIRRTYHYDQDSLLKSIIDSHLGRIDHVYDPAERLLQVFREQGPSEAFSYDAAGNITRMQSQDTDSGFDETLIYGPGNRLLQKGNTMYEYDAEGRRIKKIDDVDNDSSKVWLYEWNALDRLKKVTRPDGEVWLYKYDALARRVEKIGSGKSRQFLWDKDVIIHEADETQSLSAWIFDAYSFSPLATIQNGFVYSVINDHLGTPREIIDRNGSIVWSIVRKAWGEELQKYKDSITAVECPIRFQGQWFDEESNLCYNRFRYYAQDCGSFISSDPSGFIGGTNFFSYTPNPINWIDPFGLAACHDSGERGRQAAEDDLKAAGHTILTEEVTMTVNGKRIRADFVTQDPSGNIHVFEVKNGTGRLTDNQAGTGVFDMSNPANPTPSGGGTINTSGSTNATMTVSTSNPAKTTDVGLPAKGGTQNATFSVLKYDV